MGKASLHVPEAAAVGGLKPGAPGHLAAHAGYAHIIRHGGQKTHDCQGPAHPHNFAPGGRGKQERQQGHKAQYSRQKAHYHKTPPGNGHMAHGKSRHFLGDKPYIDGGAFGI